MIGYSADEISRLMDITKPKTKQQNQKWEPDKNIWSPKLTAENGYKYAAKVRILYDHRVKGLDPIVPFYSHFMSGMNLTSEKPRKEWLIAECPKTIGKPCPICESSTADHKLAQETGSKSLKESSDKKASGLTYLVSIKILDDRTNPENNGTYKLWKMPYSIFKQIQECMHPTIEVDEFAEEDTDTKPDGIMPFSSYDGVDLIVSVNKTDKGKTSYANTRFLKDKMGRYVQSAIADTEEGVVAILDEMVKFDYLLEDKAFQTYEKLTERLNSFLSKTDESANIKPSSEMIGRNEVRDEVPPPTDIPESHVKTESVTSKIDASYWDEDGSDDFGDDFPKSTPATSTESTASPSAIADDDFGDGEDDLPF